MQIERVRGDTYADVFVIRSNDTGDVVNLTGASLIMTLDSQKNPPDDSTQIYQLIGQISDPLSGTVYFSPSSTQANRVGLFYFDVQLTDSAGIVRTLIKDTYVYIEDITKN